MSKATLIAFLSSLTFVTTAVVRADPDSTNAPLEARTIPVRLEAQLWTRPLGADSRLKFQLLGDGREIAKTLDPQSRITTYTAKVSADEVFATATFLVVPATAKAAAYLVTQVRLYNGATGGLVAECANYDAIGGERNLGVGVCSGVIGDAQFGLTLSAP